MTTAMVRMMSMWTASAALKAMILWTGRMQVRMMTMGMIRMRIKMMAMMMKTMPWIMAGTMASIHIGVPTLMITAKPYRSCHLHGMAAQFP